MSAARMCLYSIVITSVSVSCFDSCNVCCLRCRVSVHSCGSHRSCVATLMVDVILVEAVATCT